MRLAKKMGIVILTIFIAIQFIQPARNKSGQVLPTDISKTVVVSAPVDAILKTACYDCHSNNTNYPWYASVQPFGWILNRHIRKGKAELNFSEFGSYPVRRKQSKLKSIASQVNDNEMPLGSYTWMHKKARLSLEEKKMVIEWASKAMEKIGTGK
jgi:hypothetical protein